MSQTAAFYLDPLRDIYEVSTIFLQGPSSGENSADDKSGVYNLYLLPATDQLPGWREITHHHDAWSTTHKPSLAIELLLSKSRHIRPPYLPDHKARHPPIRVAQACTWYCDYHYESNKYLPGRIP